MAPRKRGNPSPIFRPIKRSSPSFVRATHESRITPPRIAPMRTCPAATGFHSQIVSNIPTPRSTIVLQLIADKVTRQSKSDAASAAFRSRHYRLSGDAVVRHKRAVRRACGSRDPGRRMGANRSSGRDRGPRFTGTARAQGGGRRAQQGVDEMAPAVRERPLCPLLQICHRCIALMRLATNRASSRPC